MLLIPEYLTADGYSPYAAWFERLNAPAAAKVATALVRLEHGNFFQRQGRWRRRVRMRDRLRTGLPRLFRPGRRDRDLLLGGGTKKRQDRDIKTAQALWQDYHMRKKQGA